MRLCSECNSDSDVTDSRPRESGMVYRRRKCVKCEHRWSTMEVSMAQFEAFNDLDEAKAEVIKLFIKARAVIDNTLAELNSP